MVANTSRTVLSDASSTDQQRSNQHKTTIKFRVSNSETEFQSRCQPDIHDPTVQCTAKPTNDDRQCISQFFGRNKRHTATIPKEYFPVLCRTHYQEKSYRWKNEPGSKAAFQCDSILKVLQSMSIRTFIDDSGIIWPWWCGFELQFIKPDIRTDNDKPKQDEAFSWLTKLISSHSAEKPPSINIQRNTERRFFDIEQVARIVRAIKTCCVKHDRPLPIIEALPVTIGMHDERRVKEAKASLQRAERLRFTTQNDLHRLQLCSDAPCKQMELTRSRHDSAREQAEFARDALESAVTDAATTVATLPARREMKKEKNDKSKNDKMASYTTDTHQPRELSSSNSSMDLDGRDGPFKRRNSVQLDSHMSKRVKSECRTESEVEEDLSVVMSSNPVQYK